MQRSRLPRHVVRAAGLILLAILSAPCLVRASVLTFDLLDNTNDQRIIPSTYGDNISSTASDGVAGSYGAGNGFTPDIGLTYVTQHASANTPTSGFRYYNDTVWPEVAWLYTNGPDDVPANRKFDVIFTPTLTYGVRVNSFDLIDYTGYLTGSHTVNWTVQDGATILASGTATVASDGTTTVSTGMTSFYFGTATLRLAYTSGARDDLALDNVNFDQIPEPASSVLVFISGLVGIRRRR